MNLLLAIPLGGRMILLFVLGALLGGLANLATYRLAWNNRCISPWSKPDPRLSKLKIPGRNLFDRVPIWGWLGLAREAPLHGRGFWIRPMMVELFCAFGLAWLYYWEIERMALLPEVFRQPGKMIFMPMLHLQFAVHTLIMWLMLVASLIDADEKTIPDEITVPGTLFALLIAGIYPLSLLPVTAPAGMAAAPPKLSFLTITAPLKMPAWLGGRPETASLMIGLGCCWLACFALMHRRWHARYGLLRDFAIFWKRLSRKPSTWWLCALGLLGSVVIAAVWAFNATAWEGLITALVGMAASAGIIWAIRVIASTVMRREAMGFGDVTLMAMLGAFLGWQTCLIILFFAPMCALAVGLVVLLLKREHEIPFGPFLCMSATAVIVHWATIWDWATPRFELGLLIPGVVLGCLVLLPVMLLISRAIRIMVGRIFR